MEARGFGTRLRELREQAGLSQGELAEKVGVNFTYLSKIESGVRPPPSEKIILRLAEVLNADRDELMALAGKIPSDIAEMLKSRESLQSLRSGHRLKKSTSANKKESFDIRLRELREQAGLSQRELANKVGVNFTYLSKIESGVMPPPSEKVILRLAEVLNADKDELMTLAGKVPSDIAEMLKSREALQLLRSGRTQKKSGTANKKEGISIMKNLVNYKRLSKVAIPIILVCAVAASLWFTAPLPVRALEISFPDLPATGFLGGTYTFQVKVDIEDTDVLPVHHIDLEIYNVASPTTYTASCSSLPIPGTGLATASKSYTPDETGGGAVSVSVSSAYGWYYASAYRYGYGYRDPAGLGYHQFGTTFGYGYGYSGYAGATSITYAVTWTPPLGWPEGTYKIKNLVYGDANKKFSGTSSSFTLYALGGGEPSAPPSPPAVVEVEPGVVDVSTVVTEEGVFTQDVTTESDDGKVELTIDEDTIGKTKEDEPISEISVTTMAEPPAPPADASTVGLTYDLGPSGATFDPPITVTFTYDPDEIPEGVNEEDLVIAVWDEDAGKWVDLEDCTVDTATHTISAPVDHFSKFTVLSYTRPAAFTTSALSISPTEVDIGKSVTISVLVTNTGDLTGSYEVTLKIANVAVATKDVTLAGGASQTVIFTTARDVTGTYSVNVNGLSGTLTVKVPVAPPAPAAFTASALAISPTEVDIGESVTINVLVTNTGDLTGSYEVTLKIANVAVATKDVTLAGGASQTVTLTTTRDVAGTYSVDVNGLSGTFTVKVPVVPVEPINWWVWLIVGLAVVTVGVIICQVVRRRRA